MSSVPIIASRRANGKLAPAEILACGADDCVDVPFMLQELAARSRRLLKRTDARPVSGMPVTSPGPVEVDLLGQDTSAGGRLVMLTQQESDLLALPEALAVLPPKANDPGECPPLVGHSPAMQEIYRTIARLTTADLTVMINGESGTGKELVARALHDYGKRRTGPFVAINMATIPRERIESELFGYERGVFAGATNRSQGRFEQANGGTLFLDEIGDMPLEAQSCLLRVLRQGEFTSVGGGQPIKANIRIIAATHRDLRTAIRQGQFREDLFYRLNVVPIRLPPLRERAEEIGVLARHFLDRAREDGLPAKSLDQGAVDRLKQHAWPGNVRELENLMRRLAALCPEEVVSAAVVEAELADPVSTPPQTASLPQGNGAPETLFGAVERHIKDFLAAHNDRVGVTDVYDKIIDEMDRLLIRLTLAATRGNQIKAASMLGLSRTTLRKKIRDLEILVVRGA
jgi:two-component system nitrogen regulation response regulator GlnG